MIKRDKVNRKYIVLSILSAIFVLCVNYVLNNTPYPIFDDINFYSFLEYLRTNITKEAPQDGDVLYVNVAYDKTLVPYNDSNDMPLGNIEITDRAKLYRFLKAVKHNDNYKYIFLDVRFEKGFEDNSPVDSLDDSATIDSRLFSIMRNMPRLVVSTHQDIELLSDTIASKTAINDYKSTITATNFLRYRYLYDSEESVALKIYREINNGVYEKHGPLYLLNGSLCSNSPFITIKNPFHLQRENEEILPYYNLGADILMDQNDSELAASIRELTKDKFIIIGDCVEDLHDTYIGPQPGAYISYMAYKELAEGKNIISWWMFVLYGLVYGFATYFALSEYDIWSKIPYVKNLKARIYRFVFTLLGFSACMGIISGFLYLAFGVTLSVWFPSVFITTLKTIISYKKL